MKGNKRIQWADLLRVLAILAVLLCHATEEGIYVLSIDGMNNISFLSRLFAVTSFTLGRLGVPIFLILTGYFLLDRKYDDVTISKFWMNNWFHLLVCTVSWFCIYNLFLAGYRKENISFFQVIKDLLFLHRVNLSHVWYLPMIIGMYLLIPFVAKSLQSIAIKQLVFPVLFFSFYAFVCPTWQVISNALGVGKITVQLSFGFSGGVYGLYLLFGYLIKKDILKNIRSWKIIAAGIVSILSGVALQCWSYSKGVMYNIWYDCLFLPVAAMAIFELISRIKYLHTYSVIKWLAKYAFAVYLIHNLFAAPLKDFLTALTWMRPIKVMFLWVALLICSYFGAWLVGRIPKIGKYLVYIK